MRWHVKRATLTRASRWFFGVAALCTGLSSPLAAQATGIIRGRVIDAGTQRPVDAAQVTIAGTGLRAVTNASGEFTISGAPAGSRDVSVRRIGYSRAAKTVTIQSGATVTADFSISVAASQLDAVVITGTGGAVEKRTLGNSITTVNAAEITDRNTVTNVTEVLQGKTPGVTILPGSGAPGTAGEIRIRGASSLAGYKPVVFVDGVRYNIDDLGGFSATGGGTAGLAQSSQVTSALNNLNPNDIESIEVVKGPAAATLYGAEAANGVIQIITKKGTKGVQSLKWSFRGERGTDKWALIPEDNYTFCDAAKQALVNAAGEKTWPGCQGVAANTVITDNPLVRDPGAIRTADLSRTAMSLRGGGDRYSYYLSGDRVSEQGVFFNSDNSQTSARSNFGFSPTDKLDFQVNVNWQDGRLRLPIQDESANGLLLSARRGRPGLLRPAGLEGWGVIGPAQANRYKNFTRTQRLTASTTANFNPFRWMQNRLTLGFDNTDVEAQILFLPGDIDVSQDPDAASGANLRRNPLRRIVTIDYAGTLLWSPSAAFDLTTKFGSQVIADKSERLDATGIGIGAVDVTLVNLLQRTTGGEAFTENNSVGYYAQEQVGWQNRLFLTGAVRADDHSSFGTNFDLIIFPKVSLAYVLSEEPRFRGLLNSMKVNSLKLRGAWGQAGRAPTAYSAPQTYTVDRVTIGNTTQSALRTSGYGNPDLKPERGVETELGFDMGFLSERMGIDFTYYNKRTKDMLQSISIPASTGFISSRLANLGEVSNKGFEIALFGTPVRIGSSAWDTRISLATNKNELVTFNVPGKILETPSGQAYGSVQQHRVGYPLGGFWMQPALRCGIDQPPPGIVIAPCGSVVGEAMLTAAGAAIFNAGDTARRYYGSSTPTHEISFSNTFTFLKNFHLYALLDHKGGYNVFNQQERNRCQSGNDNCSRAMVMAARFPVTGADSVLSRELAVYRSASVSPEWIQKADFTKLRELSFSVDLPRELVGKTGASSGNFMISGRNLKIWSDYEGVDPEVNTYGGRSFVRVDAYAAPMMRRWTAGFNLSF
ncbi:MAG TPA: SusC/RagA family TonB-linked outer membrane protein [Gemmatimonadaceae bacterium]|nr:SusC/RagA family TonB-linked outer membrane protein [Gemmatimonadaceae bacterium]